MDDPKTDTPPLPEEAAQTGANEAPRPQIPTELVPIVAQDSNTVREQRMPESLRWVAEFGIRGTGTMLRVFENWAAQNAEETERLRSALGEADQRRESLTEALSRSNIENGRLRERLQALTADRGFRALVVALGALLAGFAPYSGNTGATVVLVIIGIVLVVAGCLVIFSPERRP